MKKLAVVLVGLLSVTQVMAQTFNRPYATCVSRNQKTKIEIKQNTNAQDTAHPFSISVERTVRGNTISMTQQSAFKNVLHHEDVLELFQNTANKSAYSFELSISNSEPSNMVGSYRAIFSDFLGRSVVYCSYQITFGN